MRLLFAGPSLAGDLDALARAHPDIVFRGPVARGDLVRAVREGATAVGIVDGLFRERPPVWHKEILHALSLGVAVAGGGSMGALRAAECGAFGMVGLGRVHRLLADGVEFDDGCVAQLHAPAALGWLPLSEAKVTVEATIDALAATGALRPGEAAALRAANRATPFAGRSFATVAAAAIGDPDRARTLAGLLAGARVDVKRADGLLVLDWLAARPDRRDPPPDGWTFAETSAWRALIAELDGTER